MATVLDSLNIKGMKKTDFEQMEEIFLHFKDLGIYWGRKEYFDNRMVRLEGWLSDINLELQNNDVKIKAIK